MADNSAKHWLYVSAAVGKDEKIAATLIVVGLITALGRKPEIVRTIRYRTPRWTVILSELCRGNPVYVESENKRTWGRIREMLQETNDHFGTNFDLKSRLLKSKGTRVQFVLVGG